VYHGKALVVELDPVGSLALFTSIRADDAISAGASPAPTKAPNDLIVKPSRIRLRVLNGTPTAGAARSAANDLAGIGFLIRGTAPADSTAYGQTLVRYGPAKADSARTVAAAIPGSALQLDQTLGSTIEVVIGTNYAGARQVTVVTPTATASPGAPTPTATASPIKTTTAADEPEGC
jgi:hypothetical protein